VKKKALSCGESQLVGLPQFAQPRTLPFFYEDGDGQAITVTSHRYTVMIKEFLATKIPSNHNLWFQQDGAMPHTAMISMAVLCCLFLLRARFHLVMRYGPSFTGPKMT